MDETAVRSTVRILPAAVFWVVFSLLVFIVTAGLSAAPEGSSPRRGLWVSSFSEKNPLNNPKEMQEFFSFARQGGFSTLFIQVYRGDKAWFDSAIADASPFRENKVRFGGDALQALIEQAHQQGIQVHAWVNVLTLSQNEEAPVLKKFGRGILTKDQYGRDALRKKSDGELDKYYERENQLFLEPGDLHVREHLKGIVSELVGKYPHLDGIHFDYIRYPASPPFIPGSRFNAVGLCYGYGEQNASRFIEKTGIRLTGGDLKPEESLLWDQWKRDQVTGLVRELSSEAGSRHPGIEVSCAVIAAFDRGYGSACQDWGLWVEKKIVDFVVLMNYSLDPRFILLACRSAIGVTGDPSKVAIGLGAYMMTEKPSLLEQQLKQVEALQPRLVVLFDYGAVSNPVLAKLFEPSSDGK